jgi:hypothetical protein
VDASGDYVVTLMAKGALGETQTVDSYSVSISR